MIVLSGKGIFGGIAIGKIAFYRRRENDVKKYSIDDTKNEYKRFENARDIALSQLSLLYHQTMREIGKSNAMIFEIQKTILNDSFYCDSVREFIYKQRVNAEYAVSGTAKSFYQMFSKLTDEYLKERSSDVRDVSERLLNILSNTDMQVLSGDEPVILAVDDLVPSETIQLDRSKVLGFVTIRGTIHSHAAILARTMNIPAVIHAGENLVPDFDGHSAVIDGFDGMVYIDPDDETMEAMRQKQKENSLQQQWLERLKGQKNRTLDGYEIDIYANIGNLTDIEKAVENDAAGIGLFRSEFLFLETTGFPTEERQFEVYKRAVEKMCGKKLVVRTFDVGSDKQNRFFTHQNYREENPALGNRGIRLCLECPNLFKTQLRALYRASAFGDLEILFPMIISINEVRQIKDIIQEVQQELSLKNIVYRREVLLGIMIETPAAVMISDLLAKEVDFFSIGTNDLVQYTLAADRQNPYLESVYNAYHISIMRMIQLTIRNAHAKGIPVGICGELAADTSLTQTFLSMGVDALSVAPSAILSLRQKVLETDLKQVKSQFTDEKSGNTYTFAFS